MSSIEKKSSNETSNEDYEKLRFISYSMRDKKWYTVKPKNINNDTYSFLNSGASGMVYVNENIKRVVKIIRLSEDNDELIKEIKKAKQEVEYQMKSAKYQLAPNVYFHEYIEKKNSFLDTPYYYIIMDYLSSKEWDNIYGDKDNIPQISQFVNTLVEKVGIINIVDPRLHFYKNKKTNNIVMIDYDHCIICNSDKKYCITKMLNAIGIHNGGKRKTHKRKTHKRKTHKRKTYKRKTQHRRITYKK
jgi:hypothetical protein